MKIYKMVCFFTALTFLLCTCNDPVFFVISREVKPIKPRISGAPRNFVLFNYSMYVASGLNLYSYSKKNGSNGKPYWNREPAPGGIIIKLASINNNKLYALCATDRNIDGRTVIKCFDNNSWSYVDGIHNDYNYTFIQDIFEANNNLFILATVANADKTKPYYALLYNDGSVTKSISENIGEVNGVVYSQTDNNYYISTTENGVWKLDNPIGYLDKLGNSENKVFTGIITLTDTNGDPKGDTLIIERDKGDVYKVDSSSSITNTGFSMGNMSTGVLAIWKDPITHNRLLLAGRQDSYYYSVSYSYSYGYVECDIDSSGTIVYGFREPGKTSPSTVIENERYQSTLGKKPVNFLFQAPEDIDSEMHLFASTQQNGVWSCRNRYDNPYEYWNAEGEDEPEKYY